MIYNKAKAEAKSEVLTSSKSKNILSVLSRRAGYISLDGGSQRATASERRKMENKEINKIVFGRLAYEGAKARPSINTIGAEVLRSLNVGGMY